MSAYFQMGNDTENLVGEDDLSEFTGIILSPVNRTPGEFTSDILSFRNPSAHNSTNYDIVLDSQLYVPRSIRGSLSKHSYFPSDLETADLSSPSWWDTVATNLADYALSLKVDAVTSPVIIPNVWSDDYYATCAETAKVLARKLDGTNTRPLLTLMVNFNQMAEQDAALKLASIASGANVAGYYLVVSSDIEPRRELVGEHQLAGIMEMITALESTGKPVLVSHCSSEMILFKAAGATSCATGKFFNLRRFGRSRFEDSASGGGQLAYWFEQCLLAFVRAADVARLQNRGLSHLICTGHSDNHWSKEILNSFATTPTKPWVRLGWRQYLSWFGKGEQTLSKPDALTTVEDWLEIAEKNWQEVSGKKVLLDEPANDGRWIRNWRQALNEYSTRL